MEIVAHASESKFRINYELFETELSKFLYIRDHYKDVAFNIIKSRADQSVQISLSKNSILNIVNKITDLIMSATVERFFLEI